MSYYTMLGLEREPFSSSPDPAFLYLSQDHKAALCRLQIAISLKRGLSVILGDVGTGKTTLSRKLSQVLDEDEDVDFNMILNPLFKSDLQFFAKMTDLFHISMAPNANSMDYMDAIEKHLFKKGVEDGKTVVLLIDESQLLPDFALETLRILLNYETNEHKLLQLILVGQMELLPRISRMHNFWDRIALKYVLHPLGEAEAKAMIDFRLRRAGYKKREFLFTDEAIRMLLRQSRGYPRKLYLLCHNALECLVMFDKLVVDGEVVRKIMEDDLPAMAAGLVDEQPIADHELSAALAELEAEV